MLPGEPEEIEPQTHRGQAGMIRHGHEAVTKKFYILTLMSDVVSHSPSILHEIDTRGLALRCLASITVRPVVADTLR